jgi:hypothetical protein
VIQISINQYLRSHSYVLFYENVIVKIKYIDEIFRYVINSEKILAKPNQPNKLTVIHLHSYISWRGYLKGIGVMSAEERTAAGKKRNENGLGVMSAKERTSAGKKGYEIRRDAKGRNPTT